MNKNCVYTVLLGNYELLNEQPIVDKSDIDFLCFTDNTNISSRTWKIIHVDPIFPMDYARSSRLYKICPHRFIDNYDASLYIDNSIILKTTPEIIFSDLTKNKSKFVCFHHSFRQNVIDEFNAVLDSQYDNINLVLEQFNAYSLIYPDILHERPIWGGFLLRFHNDRDIVNAMEDWLAQVFRYSRRDQLSFNYISKKHKLKVEVLALDIHESEYHKWPVITNRNTEYYKQLPLLSIASNHLIVSRQKYEIAQLRYENEQIAQKSLDQTKVHDQTIQLLKAQLDEQNQIAQRLAAQMASQNYDFQNIDNPVAKPEHVVHKLITKFKEDELELMETTGNIPWKITFTVLRIGIALMPPTSKRAQFVRKISRAITSPFIAIYRNLNLFHYKALLRSSDLFDKRWYLDSYPDVAQSGIDPLYHYLIYGGFERRDPGPNFVSDYYLTANNDVRKANINPLVHYLKYGKKEMRKIRP